ncbi:hypothetical protein GKQ38_05345 [Candidatus Nanohaloarchaea archaeon]|nr:hypothetical protein GKQ38_05345 [Candidatus Nanohaloarchaea archaeon]
MRLEDYLEDVDNGQTVRVRDMYRNNDYEAMTDLLEHGQVNGIDIEVDRDDADEIMEGSILEKGRDALEYTVAAALEGRYDDAFEQAEDDVDGMNHERATDKYNKQDLKAKVSDIGTAGGLAGAAVGAATGDAEIALPGLAVGGSFAMINSRLQGSRDATLQEAADGLNDAYKRHRVKIK